MSTEHLATPDASSRLWWIYLIRTPQNALYCGITTDVARRFQQHVAGKGAKALRGKSPLVLVWSQSLASRTEALQYEAALKKCPKSFKEKLVLGQVTLSHLER